MWWIIVIVVAVLAAVGVGGAAVYYYVRNANPSTDGGAACPDLTITFRDKTGTIKLSELDGKYTAKQTYGEYTLDAGTITIQCGAITSSETAFSEKHPNLTLSQVQRLDIQYNRK